MEAFLPGLRQRCRRASQGSRGKISRPQRVSSLPGFFPDLDATKWTLPSALRVFPGELSES
eukprot:8891102-Pyramimonas_sp.AAC.1